MCPSVEDTIISRMTDKENAKRQKDEAAEDLPLSLESTLPSPRSVFWGLACLSYSNGCLCLLPCSWIDQGKGTYRGWEGRRRVS